MFNYDDFLKRQTNKYVSNQNVFEVQEQALSLPVIGFGGFQPKYRGNIYSHPAVKNMLESYQSDVISGRLCSTKNEQSLKKVIKNKVSRNESRTSNNYSKKKVLSTEYFTNIKPNCNPRGNVHTTYGSNFYYEWPGSSGEKNNSSLNNERKKALLEERKFARKEGIIYLNTAVLFLNIMDIFQE